MIIKKAVSYERKGTPSQEMKGWQVGNKVELFR